MKYTIHKGDILNLDENIDATVNSANLFMSRGGEICGIIHKAESSEFAEINHFIRIAFPFFSGDYYGYSRGYALECAKEAFDAYNSEILEAVLILKEE